MNKLKIKTSNGIHRLSQKDIARKLGISDSHLSLLLAKKRTPSLALYLKMQKLGVISRVAK